MKLHFYKEGYKEKVISFPASSDYNVEIRLEKIIANGIQK
jgi:hypothetical protein